MLGGLALVVCAVAFLGGADVAQAQVWPGYAAAAYAQQGYGSGYPSAAAGYAQQGYGSGYPSAAAGYAQQGYGSGYPSAAAAYSYPGYGQGARPTSSAGYYPGYSYPNYAYSYPNNASYPRSAYPYPYPQTTGMPAMQAAPAVAAPTQPSVMLPILDPSSTVGEEPAILSQGPAEPINHDHVWLWAGYDAGFIKRSTGNVPLVTTGSVNDDHPAAIGQPGTSVLFNSNQDFGMFNGVRGSFGLFLDDCERFSLEWAGRYLLPNNVRFSTSSDAFGNPVLGRPVFDVLDGHESAAVASFPGISTGSISASERADFLGAEFNAACHWHPTECVRIEALAGFRFMRLAESLTLSDQIQPLEDGVFSFQGTPIPAVDSLSDVDSFRTVNRFYGGQIGGQVSWQGRVLFASLFGKIGVGANDQEVDINGQTTLSTPSGPIVAGGGVLAQASNSGVHTRTDVSVVPEGGVNVGVNITPRLRLTAGYSFLYWSNVVRPANEIDHNLNLSQVPTASPLVFGQSGAGGPLVPAFRFVDENFWVHSFNVGVDFHF